MILEIVQTNRFKKAYKELHKNQLATVNDAVRAIVKDPSCGQQKVGDLSWLRVYKFKCLGQLILIGYTLKQDKLVLVEMGSHENFYRDIKR